MSVLEPGAEVPSFTLAREDGGSFTNADLAGATTIFVFYPFAFSPVCTDQLQLYERELPRLTAGGERIFGVSCDSTWAQKAFKEKLAVSIEQLSDFEPKGAGSAAFGVLHPGGFSERALVITGADGIVKWSFQAPSPGELPSAELLLQGVTSVRAGS